MEGRLSKGIRFVLTNCKDPSREAEFNDWYNQVHLPDMLSSGLVSHATRYQNAAPQPGEPNYLAIYEIDKEDMEAIPQQISRLVQHLTQQGRMCDALEVVHTGMWRRTGPQFSTAKMGQAWVTGQLVTQTNCADLRREGEFNTWYNETHIPDILGTGLFHTAYRFEALSPQLGQPKYLGLYETDANDPVKAVDELLQVYRPRWLEAGRYTDTLQVTWRSVFRRL